jgi:hypothetical protein
MRAPPSAIPRAAPAAGPARSGSTDDTESAGSLSPVSSAGDVLLGELPGATDPAPAWRPGLRSPAASPRGGDGAGGGGARGSADDAGNLERPGGGGRARSGDAGSGGDPASLRPERGGGEGPGGGFGAGRVPQVVSRGSCLNGSSYPSPHLDGGRRGAGADPARQCNLLCSTRVSRLASASTAADDRQDACQVGACTCACVLCHTCGNWSHAPRRLPRNGSVNGITRVARPASTLHLGHLLVCAGRRDRGARSAALARV